MNKLLSRLAGRSAPNPGTHGLFLRAFGLIALIAFVGYWRQMPGLIGSGGVMPASLFFHSAGAHLGAIERWYLLPTLAWLSSTDTSLHIFCLVGTFASLALIAGFRTKRSCAIIALAYLSLAGADRVFLSFQWDSLLVETAILCIFIAPDRLFAARWLLFKLMLCSGICKLASGDAVWRSLDALRYHYETQPLPTPLAWWAHQLPDWAHTACAGLMFAVELAVPFLVFLRSRPVRLTAFAAIVGFQIVIMATGNYGFFNWLTIALCLPLLEDRDLPSGLIWLARIRERTLSPWIRRIRSGTSLAYLAAAIGIGAIQIAFTVNHDLLPEPVYQALVSIAPFRVFNNYGLFATMTTERDEIAIEGSDDKKTWRAYRFIYKPNGPDDAPHFVAPYQPRLDWQMWFAALADYEASPWLKNLEIRLLQGNAETLQLMGSNPFPKVPPKYVRARIARFRFDTEHGHWWTKDSERDFGPTLSL